VSQDNYMGNLEKKAHSPLQLQRIGIFGDEP